MKPIKFYQPIWESHFSPELWFDNSPTGEFWFHLFSIQIRSKEGMSAVCFTFLGFTALVTSPFLSELLNKYTAPIIARNPAPENPPPNNENVL